MTKLQRFIPQTPDPFLRQSDQLGAVKFGHLNALVDALNATVYGDYLQLQGDGPMSTTLRALEDPVGNIAQLYLATDKTAISSSLKIGGITPNVDSAILQIDSNTKGVLFPRMTVVERDAIVSPAVGLLIYNTDDLILNIWDGTEWTEIGGGGLGLLNGALMTSTLTPVVDKENTESVLLLSTNKVGISADSTATTQITAVIQAIGTNSGIALVPNGTGAITAQVPDGTVAGGNARGENAVDLQIVRTDANQVASGDYSIAIGKNNRSAGTNSVAMGDSNTVTGLGIGIGYSNIVNATDKPSAAIGFSNTVGGYCYALGYGCTASAEGSVALGNFAKATGGIALAFGYDSQASGGESISLGRRNKAQSQRSTVSGGESNTASTGTHATVVGGANNVSSGQHSVSGGSGNTASGTRSIALGGSNNAQAEASVTLGQQNVTTQPYSIAKGYFALSYLYGQESHQNGRFDSASDAQVSTLVARKFDDLTTGGTTVLSLDGTGTTNLIIPTGVNRVWNVLVKTVAVVIGTSGTTTGVTVGDTFLQNQAILFKKIGGISSVVDLATDNTFADGGMSSASMAYTAGASQELALTFTAPTYAGGGSVALRIVSKVELVEVAYA